ncbi:DUF3164 family protein [uncultured Cohaesibacter sp.]|uniref:DUF3164 family protein n=1 Tax=uncultured Cohaesibacter sp. TaxID=1002546 RepID=UPI002AAB13D8|nr:DUF3164 family protein [uncultured Cohaesibacter sp.]
MNYQSEFKPAEVSSGIISANGQDYMPDAKGSLVPVELIKPADLLEDQTVRSIMGYAIALSEQLSRFLGHTMTDLGELDSLLAEQYDLIKGGKKGNRTYSTVDGLFKVKVQVADLIDFGPQLQIAKQLIDECLNEWSEASRPEIRAIITRAFNTEKEGQVNRADIFMLLRLDISDERWIKAMEALRDAMRVIGSKEYVRFYRRKTVASVWEPVTIDLAKV